MSRFRTDNKAADSNEDVKFTTIHRHMTKNSFNVGHSPSGQKRNSVVLGCKQNSHECWLLVV